MERVGYYPGCHARNNVVSFLDDQAAKDPDHPIFHWVSPTALKAWPTNPAETLPHQSIAVGAFGEGVRRTAAGFHELGIRRGDRIILFLPMSVALYTAMFALQRLGAVPVFLDSWARRDQLEFCVRLVQPCAMVSFAAAFAFCADIPELRSIPIQIVAGPADQTYSARLEELLQTPATTPLTPMVQEETALVTFTTGSSDRPRWNP